VVVRFKDCIDDFKQILPLVEELANPALKSRHWEQIFKARLARGLAHACTSVC
jgi:dynein heavy chain